jgi:hypothetical protein
VKKRQRKKPKCKKGISDRDLKEPLHWRTEITFGRLFRNTVWWRRVETFIGLRGVGNWTVWKVRPLPKCKKKLLTNLRAEALGHRGNPKFLFHKDEWKKMKKMLHYRGAARNGWTSGRSSRSDRRAITAGRSHRGTLHCYIFTFAKVL